MSASLLLSCCKKTKATRLGHHRNEEPVMMIVDHPSFMPGLVRGVHLTFHDEMCKERVCQTCVHEEALVNDAVRDHVRKMRSYRFMNGAMAWQRGKQWASVANLHVASGTTDMNALCFHLKMMLANKQEPNTPARTLSVQCTYVQPIIVLANLKEQRYTCKYSVIILYICTAHMQIYTRKYSVNTLYMSTAVLANQQEQRFT